MALANRHGLIAGATGTGKTVTLQRLVEQVSRIGVPSLLADVKGDLSCLAAAGQEKAAFSERREQLGLPRAAFAPCPVEFWDVLGEQGHPLRAGVFTIAFRIADDQGLLLLDLKDLQELLRHLSDNARTDGAGHGVVNILAADQLVLSPKLYATVMLWLLSQLYEQLREVGDSEKPKLLVIFDEAHLLFAGAPPVLLEKVEQVVRLIRSKDVGSQEQKALKDAATSFRPNPPLDVEAPIGELAVGEALVSCLDAAGAPTPVERPLVVPRPCTTTTAKPRIGNRPMNCCVSRHGSAAWSVPSLAGCPPLRSRRGAWRDLCPGQRPPAVGGRSLRAPRTGGADRIFGQWQCEHHLPRAPGWARAAQHRAAAPQHVRVPPTTLGDGQHRGGRRPCGASPG